VASLWTKDLLRRCTARLKYTSHSNPIMANPPEPLPYDEHDYGVIASNVYHELCQRDKEDREAGRPPAWHDLTELVSKMDAYTDKIDIAYLAETILNTEREFIKRYPANFDVRLTGPGRDNCDRGIDIPKSESVIRPDTFYHS
jgi:hypothetical protein